MGGGVDKEIATQGIEGSDQTSSENEATHPINNCVEEGSSSFSVPVPPEMMKESPKIQMDDAENTKAPSSANPRFYIERTIDLLIVMVLSLKETRIDIRNFAISAFIKLLKIVNAGKPLWKPLKEHKYEVMDKVEYLKGYSSDFEKYKEAFINQTNSSARIPPLPSQDSLKLPAPAPKKKIPRELVKVEGSRDVEIIKMSAIDLVRLFMDVNQWSATFSNIISRASFHGIIANGVEGGYDGRIQVISAELHLPTPLVATLEYAFGRYSKKVSSDTWLITDFPLDKFLEPIEQVFQRKVSGCLIQEMPNGYSKVTWVERIIADGSKLDIQFQPFVYSGLAFGANTWLASLIKNIEFSETLKAENTLTVHGTKMPEEGRAGFLKLAELMMRTFNADLSGTLSNQWHIVTNRPLEGGGSIDMKARVKSVKRDFGKPEVATLFFATSIPVHVSPLRLFDFFRAEDTIHKKLNIFLPERDAREIFYVDVGNDPRNRVSIVQVETILDDEVEDMFYLQESLMYSSGSYYVVYSPVEKHALSNILNGGDPSNVVIGSSGFVFLPDGVSLDDDDNNEGGTVLTIGLIIDTAFSGSTHIVNDESIAIFCEYVDHMLQAIKVEFPQN